jgi:hypothetical protein
MSITRRHGELLALILVGCGQAISAGAQPPNFRYYIGKEVVVVQVTTTVKKARRIETLRGDDRSRCIEKHGDPAPDPELCLTDTTTTTREGAVNTKLVPDPKLGADLNAAGKAFTDDAITVELRDGMLLHSINAQSTGRAGEVIVSIAKFAGFLFGAPGLLASVTPPAAPVRAVSTCNPFTRPLADQPDTVRLWLWENQTQCERWNEIRTLQKAREALIVDRTALEHDIRGATGTELKLLLDKLKAVEDAIKRVDADLKPRQDAFNTQFETFAATLQLGSSSSTQSYDQVLDLSELPLPAGLSAGQSEAQADQVATKFSDAAKELWKQARLIVTLNPAFSSQCETPPSIPPGDKNDVRVYFRQGAPARMRAFIADQTSDPASKLRVVGDRFDNFVHSCLPVSAMTFSRSVWTSRELSLTFDDRGRPVKLVRTSKSDAAAIAASVSSATTAFRDEITATVGKVVELQSNRRKIDMDDLTRRLERAKGEKDLLDAQLAFDTASTNFDAALKQKQATATLDALKAELALASAQSTAEQTQQIELLKLAVTRINQELELIKAQQALDKARE